MKKIIITFIILSAILLALYYFLLKKEKPAEVIPEDQSTIIQNTVDESFATIQVEQPKPEVYDCNNLVEIEWFPGRQNEAMEIGRALRDKLNCTVRILPAWNRRIGPEEPQGGDIRYFWAQDEKGAQAVADFVNNSFSEKLTVYAPYPEKLTDNSGGLQRKKKGYLEIWLKKSR